MTDKVFKGLATILWGSKLAGKASIYFGMLGIIKPMRELLEVKRSSNYFINTSTQGSSPQNKSPPCPPLSCCVTSAYHIRRRMSASRFLLKLVVGRSRSWPTPTHKYLSQRRYEEQMREPGFWHRAYLVNGEAAWLMVEGIHFAIRLPGLKS